MVFEYKPELQGTHESLWTFEIPAFKLVQHFLVVGRVLEPKVFFEVGKVDFGPLLIGGKNNEVIRLKNLDYLPYHFNFDKKSIKGENEYGDSLNIHPLSGVVNGESEVPLNISFKPKIEGKYNYNLVCNVAQKPRPLTLNVKGIGYMLHHSVHLNHSTSLISPTYVHEIDFGSSFVNEQRTRTISIKNNGDFNFDFMIKKTSFNYVQITPETSTVKTGDKVDINIVFNPIKEYKLRSNMHTITLSIVSGPSYHFKLNGSARKPGVEVSFHTYDFGPCFVMKTPIQKTVILKMRNIDETAISIDPLFEKKKYLDVQLPSGQVLLPVDKNNPNTGVLEIPIVFTPRETKKYDEIVSFDINQLHQVDVRIMGEGIPMRIDLKRTEDSFIDFGICRVGSDNTVVVPVTNYSKSQIAIDFNVGKQLEDFHKINLSIRPEEAITINPKESKDIEISFNPDTRINSFKHDLKYRVIENDEISQLLVFQGCCQGMDLKLMDQSINFGSVVINSKIAKKVQMNNMGDMGAKFEWDTTFCKPFFSITPMKGFLPANDALVFVVDFHPNVAEEHNFTVRCNIENGAPLTLNLIGRGISQVLDGVQTLKFETIVRNKVTQKVQVKNPIAEKINIKANITSTLDKHKGYFYGPEFIQVNANDKADYEITYYPLTMTTNDHAPKIKDDLHQGRLFFPLPDGSALIYDLSGKANPPQPTETISATIKAKNEHIQLINLENWLKITQRLNVDWKKEANDESVIIQGANTIDLQAEGKKQYKLNIFALKQGTSKITLTFRNTVTDEFIYFILNLTVTPPDPIESFELVSVVRDSIKKVVAIMNPLTHSVEIKKENITIDTDLVSFNPPTFVIPAKSEYGLELNYRPLTSTESKNTLKINSPDLGEFVFLMKLIGTETNVSQTMNFKAPLGSDIVQTYKFRNFVKKPTTYQVKIERLGVVKPTGGNPKDTKAPICEFTVDNANVNAPAADSKDGVDVAINVRFEPSNLNESSAMMVISSSEGGSYNCYLIGQTINPQPKGPYKMSGKGINIEFKNPLFEACEFIIRIDNPAFTTSVKSPLKIDAKKQVNIPIAYKATPGYSSNGRVMISVEGLPQWTFYVQGE